MDSVPELLNSRYLVQPAQESLGCAVDPLGGEKLGSAKPLSSLLCCSQLPEKFIKGQHKDFGDHNEPACSCKGGFGKGANRHLSVLHQHLWPIVLPLPEIHPSGMKMKAAGEGERAVGESQHPAHCSFHLSCLKATPSFPISLFLTFSGGGECLFSKAVQVATQLAWAEPSSKGSKSPSKNAALRSLEKSLGTASAPCHTYPFCAVY